MLQVTNITKSYNGRQILNIPDFSFAQGGRYALIGSNGSGKSTLLRILAGALLPDSGQVSYADGIAEQMGYMPQHAYGFSFSVLKNVMIALENQENSREIALAALEKVNLLPLAEARGSTLSGGETQRLAFARMIAIPRPLLLLDEPTSATDIAGNDCVEQVLLDYCTENNCTLIFATHSLPQAKRLAEQVVLLDHGQIIEQGTCQQVLHNPQSEVAQTFLAHWRLE